MTDTVKEEQVSIRMRRRQLERIRKQATAQDMQVSEFLRLAIMREVERLERRGNA